MLIKIDTREQELYKKCELCIETVIKFKDIKLVYETLPLGDIIINDEKHDKLIIERKSVSDLVASIKDGRYEEQSYRLNGLNQHNHNIVYLIEGDINNFNTFKERIDKQTIYSAMFSINYYKGFSLMRSFSMEETATIICNMAYKMGKDVSKDGFYANDTPTNDTPTNGTPTNDKPTNDTPTIDINANAIDTIIEEKEYCKVIKKVKKENITEGNIGEIMLCQIPGVSSTSAIAILAQFKTLPNLIKSIQEDQLCLNSICTIDTNGKSRKISKTIIANIIKFLRH